MLFIYFFLFPSGAFLTKKKFSLPSLPFALFSSLFPFPLRMDFYEFPPEQENERKRKRKIVLIMIIIGMKKVRQGVLLSLCNFEVFLIPFFDAIFRNVSKVNSVYSSRLQGLAKSSSSINTLFVLPPFRFWFFSGAGSSILTLIGSIDIEREDFFLGKKSSLFLSYSLSHSRARRIFGQSKCSGKKFRGNFFR